MNYLEIKPEVQDALNNNGPVVALESTIIAHGMPYPENVKTALEVERIIREQGAVPATIAIIDGRVKIGLSPAEIEFLAGSGEVIKVSRRDFPVIVARKKNGATTVAGTMIAASMAGIKVFVTGGIGGVHRGADKTFDISADLEELSRTSVAVVAAGAKSILDLKLTLERLETLGVPVLGYKTDEFPAFYSRKSGLNVDYRIETPLEAAKIIKTKFQLGLQGGLLICNPVPEEDEIQSEKIEGIIEKAILKAEQSGICGKELTPYLLEEIKKITRGQSLKANISLVKNNALIGAKIALELAGLNC